MKNKKAQLKTETEIIHRAIGKHISMCGLYQEGMNAVEFAKSVTCPECIEQMQRRGMIAESSRAGRYAGKTTIRMKNQ